MDTQGAVQAVLSATILQALQNGQNGGQPSLTSVLGGHPDLANQLSMLLSSGLMQQQAPQLHLQQQQQHENTKPQQSPNSEDNGDMNNDSPHGRSRGGGGGGGPLGPMEGGVDAKEKNRLAQRRFRERQKSLIGALKDQVDDLTRQVEDSQRELQLMRQENNELHRKVEGYMVLQRNMQP